MLELDKASFDALIEGENLSLVDFWAPWCMPCKILAPVLEELSDELDGKVDFAKLNIDDHPDLASKYEVTGIPTLILFKAGKPVERMVGVRPKDDILRTLQNHIQ